MNMVVLEKQLIPSLMENSNTDKEILGKGIRTMLVCLLLIFIGPTTIHIDFSNSD